MLTWDTILVFLSGFLSGTLVGASGKYLADKFTDQRHNQEAARAAAQQLAETRALMPQLFDLIRADVVGDPTVRLCVLLPSPTTGFNLGGQSYFMYAETEHDNLRGKFTVLANRGYVRQEHTLNIPSFTLGEEFVSALRQMSDA